MVSKTGSQQLISKIILWIIILITIKATPVASQLNISCPDPLIHNPTGIPSIEIPTCLPNGCCLPCPVANNFYPSAQLNTAYMAFGVLGIVASLLMIFLMASYIYLPSLHDSVTTRKILIPFALSVIIFSATDFFTVHQKSTQCINPVQQATIHNNRLCLMQSLFALGGAYALAGWASLLLIHLHLLSVWRSAFITNHIIFFHIIIWLIALLATIIPIVTDSVTSGNTCFITAEGGPVYYIPMGFVYIAFVLHIFTLGYITNTVLKADEGEKRRSAYKKRRMAPSEVGNSLKKLFRLQWRALAGALLMLIIYVTAWVFFTFKNKVPNFGDPWFEEWLQCLTIDTQTSCSSIAAPHFPSFSLIVLLLITNRCAGIFIFLLLAVKKTIFYEWTQLLSNKIKDMRETTPA